MTRPVLVILCGVCVGATTTRGEDAPSERPVMRQLRHEVTANHPPSSRDLARERVDFRRRFAEPLSHTETAAGARQAAETLLQAAATETDRTARWMLLDEARRLGESAGEAELVSRAIGLAAAAYDYDAIAEELLSLARIPLRGVDGRRAAGLARAAERLSFRAEADGRPDKAAEAARLAYRASQRSGNVDEARRAAERCAQLEAGRRP